MFRRSRRPVFVLSIDGGGIRGLLPALVLRELASRIARIRGDRGAVRFDRIFDLISGTSTGGLIALGLCKPRCTETGCTDHPDLTVEQMVEMYATYGATIFPRSRFASVRAVMQAFSEKYDSEGIETVLADTFGDVTVQDALTNLLITSYDTERRHPVFFKKKPHASSPDNLNFFMRDVGRATAAAPTFFEPAYIGPVPDDGRRFCLVDGGVFANNPAVCAYIEARRIFPRTRRVVMVSLGTGSSTLRFTYAEMRNWGYIDWVSPSKGVPLSSMMMDGQSEAVSYQLRNHPRVDYHRFNGSLAGFSEEMDDAGEKNIRDLRILADTVIRTNDAELERTAKILARRPS